MAKKISKKIDSQFMPTYIDGVPIFMCGGKMKYDLGGTMMPGGIGYNAGQYIQDEQQDDKPQGMGTMGWISAAQAVGNMGDKLGQSIGGDFGNVMSGTFRPEKGFQVLKTPGVSGTQKALSFLAPGYGNMLVEKNKRKEQLDSQVKDRAMASIQNLPGQPNYVPTFGDGGPIKQREDFKGNFLSYMASGNKRRDSYGKLGDLYRYYGGDPLKHNVLYKSEYKPTNSKNLNASYISIKDKDFADRIVEHGNRLFVDKNLNLPSDEEIQSQKNGEHKNSAQWKDNIINKNTISVNDWGHPVGGALGRYFVSKGNDNKGDYLSYYDEFDVNQPGEKKSFGDNIGATKPFEVYDRIYVNKDANGRYIRRNTIPQIENSPIDKTKLKSWEHGAQTFENGGEITDRVSSIDNGSSHEASPFGGIPIGQNALLEKDEFIFKNKAGKKYVFSNKIFR